MVKTEWVINRSYKRGDIVFIKNFDNNDCIYYVCAINHISDELINPRQHEEIYWIKIENDMLTPVFTNYDLEQLLAPLEMERVHPERRMYIERPLTEEEYKEKQKQKKLKRKIQNVDDDIVVLKKKRKIDDDLNLEDQIKLLNVDLETKMFLLDKNESIKKAGCSDAAKGKTWLKTVLKIPFGKFTPFKIKASDNPDKINAYFKSIRSHLDSKIHNIDNVKDEIMEYLARKISNPKSKGHVLALCGSAGVGKTKILKTLGEALSLPFYQINFGGLNDVSVLTGHSETYIGSKPGKFVEIIGSAGCMNPIIFCDEIDKLSGSKSREINGVLTHVLDEEQNDKFQDNYLSNININLSQVFFVIAFNDFDQVDRIVSDRMKVVYINPPQLKDKVIIAVEKMIPDIIESFKFKKDKYINLDIELIEYIISNKVPKEDGVRQLRKCLEKIFSRLNLLILTGQYKENTNLSITIDNNIECINIKKNFIDNYLEVKNDNTSHLHMYI